MSLLEPVPPSVLGDPPLGFVLLVPVLPPVAVLLLDGLLSEPVIEPLVPVLLLPVPPSVEPEDDPVLPVDPIAPEDESLEVPVPPRVLPPLGFGLVPVVPPVAVLLLDGLLSEPVFEPLVPVLLEPVPIEPEPVPMEPDDEPVPLELLPEPPAAPPACA